MLPRSSLAIHRYLYLIQLAGVLLVLVLAESHRLAAQQMNLDTNKSICNLSV